MGKNDWLKLQQIYEGFGGLGRDTAPNSMYKGGDVHKHSYRGELPFNSGGSDNLYARMAADSHGPIPIENEEERVMGSVEKQTIIDKIKELQNDSEDAWEPHAADTHKLLSDLIEFIKSV